MKDFWYVRTRPEERQRVQDGYTNFVAERMRENAFEEARRRELSDHANLVAAMAVMLADNQRAKPDLWAEFVLDNEALATVIADYLLARARDRRRDEWQRPPHL